MKRILINEEQANSVMDYIVSESFIPSAEKTLLVKDYLDRYFIRRTIDDLDANGYPKKTPVAIMVSVDKQPLRTLQMEELLLLLVDKFNGMVKDEADLKAFMKQIIMDWFQNRISKSGILSVNHV